MAFLKQIESTCETVLHFLLDILIVESRIPWSSAKISIILKAKLSLCVKVSVVSSLSRVLLAKEEIETVENNSKINSLN